MHILFLCSSLEPGKDGVGDYTQKLAAALEEKGNTVAIIALSDRHIQTHSRARFCRAIETLRLPSGYSWKKRMVLAQPFARQLKQDWLSLQFVSFGFNPKGLPFGLSKHIKKLQGNAKLHVMFHELWVGFNQASSLKLKLWSIAQQGLFRNFLHRLCPAIITANTSHYSNLLQGAGFKSSVLPLFSNIRVVNTTPKSRESRSTKKIIVFGTIHPGAPGEAFMLALKHHSDYQYNSIEFIFAGNNGNEKEEWEALCKQYGFTCTSTGWQNEENISAILSSADIGVTTTPYKIIGKSGSVAAMLAHKLPVISISVNNDPGETSESSRIFVFDKENPVVFPGMADVSAEEIYTAEAVADELYKLLSQQSN